MILSGGYESKLALPVEEIVGRATDVYGLRLEMREEPRFGYNSTTLRVRSEADRYVLKVLDPREYGEEDVARSIETQSAVAQRLPVALPVAAADGRFCADVGRCLLILYPEAVGEPHKPSNLEQIRSSGAALATIHAIDSASLALPPSVPIDVVASHRPGTSSTVFGLLEDRLAHVDWSRDDAVLLHGDYRAQNLLFRGDTVSCVLDWDDAAYGSKPLDICYSLIFFRAVIHPDPPGLPEMRAFLDGYQQSGWLRPGAWDQMADYLDLALLRGLSLWAAIRETTRDEDVLSRTTSWIDSYTPLAESIPGMALELR